MRRSSAAASNIQRSSTSGSISFTLAPSFNRRHANHPWGRSVGLSLLGDTRERTLELFPQNTQGPKNFAKIDTQNNFDLCAQQALRQSRLGNTDSSWYYADIDYAFFVGPSAGLEIWESGNQRGSFGTYASGDRLRVAVEGGVVKYFRNGTLVYTSTVAPTYPLQVDTSLNTVNAGVYNVVITSDLQNVTWTNVASTIQVTNNDIRKVSGTNTWYDAGVGMRTWGQGFGAEDKIRQRYAMTERDDSTGLDHTWWRKYENRSGRWTSPDPYNGSMTIANPQSFNRYAYVQNDPVNFVDPSGLLPVLVCGYTWMNREYGWVYGCSVRDVPEPQDPHDPRGGGRGGPQQSAPGRNEKEINNCQRFAAALDQIANNSQSETNFLDELARTFLRSTAGHPANSGIGEMRLGAGGVLAPGPASFLGNSGIRSEFRGQSDEQGQIRHFVGSVIAASYGFFGQEFMIQREDENSDSGRADVAVSRLAFSIYNDVTGPLGARGRIDQIRKRFADEIRRKFCQ